MKFRIEQLRDIKSLVKELANGLMNLTFAQNFNSFEQVVEITATTELSVRNQLTKVPERYIVVSQTGNGLITKGSTEWTKDYITFYNNGSVTVTATILILE